MINIVSNTNTDVSSELKMLLTRVNSNFKDKKEYLVCSDSILAVKHYQLSNWQSEIVRLKKLLTEIPKRLGWNLNDIIQNLNIKETDQKYLMAASELSPSTVFRTDMIMTAYGPKILEFNLDKTVPQFQVPYSLKNIYGLSRKYCDEFYKLSGIPFPDWLDLARMFATKNKNIRQDIFWDVDRTSENVLNQRNQILKSYAKIKNNTLLKTGINSLVDDYSSKNHHRIFAYVHFLNNQDVNITSTDLANEIGSAIVFDNKLLLGYLYTKDFVELLSKDEVNLVNKYVPKTRLTKNLTTKEKLELVKDKNNWVLKKGNSWQGQDVLIGKSTSQEQFAATLDLKNWIIQEYVEPNQLRVNLIDGHNDFKSEGTNLLNFYFIDDTFSGSIIRVCKTKMFKIGAIDYKNVIPIPLISSAINSNSAKS